MSQRDICEVQSRIRGFAYNPNILEHAAHGDPFEFFSRMSGAGRFAMIQWICSTCFSARMENMLTSLPAWLAVQLGQNSTSLSFTP